MRYLHILFIISIFVAGCSATTVSYDDPDIQMLKDPVLLFAFDYFGEGISLGMESLGIKFENADYYMDSNTVLIQGQVIDESTKEAVPFANVFVARKLNFNDKLSGYNIILSDSVQADHMGRFSISAKLFDNSVITSKVIGFYGSIYNIGELRR